MEGFSDKPPAEEADGADDIEVITSTGGEITPTCLTEG